MVGLWRTGTRMRLVLGGVRWGWDGRLVRGKRGPYFSGIVKANLTGGHGGCFVEVGPGGVDYCDVIFFVAWRVLLAAS